MLNSLNEEVKKGKKMLYKAIDGRSDVLNGVFRREKKCWEPSETLLRREAVQFGLDLPVIAGDGLNGRWATFDYGWRKPNRLIH